MKVDGNNLGSQLKGLEQQTKSTAIENQKAANTTRGVGKDQSGAEASKVNLSPEAQQMQKAFEVARNTDAVDEAKVERLQKLIDKGQYQVDSEQVADRLVDTHMDFTE